jgi:hypothetical protein
MLKLNKSLTYIRLQHLIRVFIHKINAGIDKTIKIVEVRHCVDGCDI